MLYIGNNKIIKGYIGNTPIAYAGFGKSDLIKIEGESGGEEYPENTVAVYTVSGTSAVAPFSVSGKASDWLETCRDNGDGTSTMIITASTPPSLIRFQNRIQLLSVEYININNIVDISYMFSGCTALTSINIRNWDTSNITNMGYMFHNCNALTSLDLSSFNTRNVTNMQYMFNGCNSLVELDLSNFSVESIEWKQKGAANQRYFKVDDMYSNCNSLKELRLDNCDEDTIKKLSYYSYTNKDTGSNTYYYWSPGLPTYTDGSVHNVYLKKSNWTSSTFRTGWTINYIEE